MTAIQGAIILLENEAATEAAEDMMDRRTCEGTKKQYDSAIGLMITWMKTNHPHLVESENNVDSLKMPLNDAAVLQWLAVASKKPNGKYKSYSCISGYKSAIGDLYTSREQDMQAALKKKLKKYSAGYKRTIADLKQNGEIPMQEGKLPVTFQGYACLALIALNPFRGGLLQDVAQTLLLYAHLYLIWQWNLMARTVSIATCRYEHITWNRDSLVVHIPRHKGDTEAAHSYPKHVYANPYNPLICPVLALALHIACTSYRTEESQSGVFAGGSIDSKFSKWLLAVLEQLTDLELIQLGVPVEDVGTHSVRKGVASFASSIVGGATMIAVFLRLGWGIGNVQQRYIFQGEGSDQVLGRCVCGLNLNEVEFTVLPPHFDSPDVLTIEELNLVVPGFSGYPAGFRFAIPFLLASLVYHSEWLNNNLPRTHPYFNCAFYRHSYGVSLKPRVLLGLNKCATTGMQATGIPPHMATAYRVSEVEKSIQRMNEDNATRHSEIQAMSSTMLTTLPRLVVNEIREHCVVTGMQPLTMIDLERVLGQRVESILSRFNEVNAATGSATATAQHQVAAVHHNTFEEDIWPRYYWAGRYHFTPSIDYIFPS